MGNLSARLSEERPPARCKFARLLVELDKEDQAAVLAFMEQSRMQDARRGQPNPYSPAKLTQALRDEGFQLSPTTTEDHIRGTCCCEPAR